MDKRTKYLRNPYRIEIIITYKCNRKCYNCCAMVHQAPTKQFMTEEQIKKFVKESVEKKIKWEKIRVIGGEPTLHPNIYGIVKILNDYKTEYSKNTTITIVSNGSGKYVNQVLHELQSTYGVEIENSNKTSDIQPTFWPVNQAPIDMEKYRKMDFSKACWMTTICGGALDINGFYPCFTAAVIARTTGKDFGRKYLPSKEDTMEDLFEIFCPLCGHYYNQVNQEAKSDIIGYKNMNELEIIMGKYFKYTVNEFNLQKEVISKSWKDIFDKYMLREPIMKKYQ